MWRKIWEAIWRAALRAFGRTPEPPEPVVLRELRNLHGDARRTQLRHKEVSDAFAQLGQVAAVRWLAENIESPVTDAWGHAPYARNPTWEQLHQWMNRDKVHCLAAIDALLRFSHVPRLPEGANEKDVNMALDAALARYGNPRLQEAAKELRYVWPAGERPRHAIDVPATLDQVATALFQGNTDLVAQWHEAMTTALDTPRNIAIMWGELITFADEMKYVARIDWREGSEEVGGRLRDLAGARDLKVDWDDLASFDGETEPHIHHVGTVLRAAGEVLVNLDEGSDSYALSIMLPAAFEEFHAALKSVGDTDIKADITGDPV